MSQRTRRWAVLSALLLGVAFGVRLWQLGREALWLDEVLTVMHLQAPDLDA